MATRKLKFKPKPVVGGAVRRPREKEEIPESTAKEPNEKEVPQDNIATHIGITKETNYLEDDKDASESILKKLRIEQPENTLSTSSIDCNTKASNLGNCSTLSSDVAKRSRKETMPHITSNESNPSCNLSTDNQSEKLTDFSINKLVNSETVSTRSSETNPNLLLVDPVCSQDRTSNELSSGENSTPNMETNSMISSNLSQESPVNSKSTDKTETGKVLSRFGRAKFKPVLNNSVARKKTQSNDNLNSSENANSEVYPVAIVRTESVIKCGKSQVNKCSIVSEITESFSALESDESDLLRATHPITPSTENNESSKNTYRFEFSSEEVRNTMMGLNRSNPVQQIEVTSNFTQSNINNVDNLTLESDKVTGKTDSNQLHQILDNTQHSETDSSAHLVETSNNSAQPSSANKVPISPLKFTSKMLVPKPCPNLLDTGVRRISFHGSDSEEESKRKNFLKNDQLGKKIKKEKDVKNNKRKLSQGSTYSKLGQEALEKFTQKFGKVQNLEPTDKAKLTMLDLIFYNPKSNPMTVSTEQQTAFRKKEDKFEVSGIVKEALAEESVDDVEAEPSAPAVPVPQLKVGPDGQIMLDPKSLVIETTEVKEKRAEMEKSEVIRETGITRYNTYSKKKHTRRDWSAQETLQFYKALNTIGSDFTLMTKLFPRRSRHELKLKFKKEEKTNMKLVDLAMTAPADFDFCSLEEEMKRENEEIAQLTEEKRLAAEAARKARAMKKEEKEKNKGKKVLKYPRTMKTRDAAFRNFDEPEIGDFQKLCDTKKPKTKKRVARKKQTPILVASSSDEDKESIRIDYDSDEADTEEIDGTDMKILKLVKEQIRGGGRTRRGRKVKQTKKLEEYEEINETLKRKLEEIESDSDDGYTPNGLAADMLFGSPTRDPFPDHPSQEAEGSQWSMQVTSVPSVESTIFGNNVEDVSELSELGSFGQNVTALDLSVPLRTSTQDEVLQDNVQRNSVLNRHLISESVQIIDQLTSGENVTADNENITLDRPDEDGGPPENPADEDLIENRIPLPSFESVSRSLHPVVYSVQEQYLPAQSVEDGATTHEQNNPPSIPVESDHRDDGKDNNQQGIVLSYYCNDSEECILGD